MRRIILACWVGCGGTVISGFAALGKEVSGRLTVPDRVFVVADCSRARVLGWGEGSLRAGIWTTGFRRVSGGLL